MQINFFDGQLRASQSLELMAKYIVEGFISGLHKSPYQGFSVEFAEHRAYTIGESTRHLDWKLLARTDRHFVKRFEAETNLRCWCVIDTSASMFYPLQRKIDINKPNKLVFSLLATASIIHLLKSQRDAFGLAFSSSHLSYKSDARLNSLHQRQLFEKMAQLLESEPVKGETNLAKSLHQLADQLPNRSLVLVFTDLFETEMGKDALNAAFQHLRFKKHEVSIFHVTDSQTELLFDFENQPLRFIDAESGEVVDIEPNEIKEFYTKAIAEFVEEMKLRCGLAGIEWVSADISKSVSAVLLEFIKKRTKMY